ncbi:HNH endonuclease [Caballeronia sp. dw_19]|uniref:HNH endonuclease n=1 Tax=Caballeronia sp. dw_19 TaxID=2719791 RepID=UPI001BD19637|nr:HNH endonuclease [Caballeronia sp. dw_19]
MATVSNIARWIPETDGERLFLAVYQYVAPSVPALFADQSWLVSSAGLTELCRLIASMELTYRSLNVSVELYEANERASVNALMHRLRLIVGLHQRLDITTQIAQSARLAALAYINRKLTVASITEVHRNAVKTCCWCGIPTSRKKGTPSHFKATVEHLWPEFLGGDSSPENLAIACGDCNSTRQHAFNWAWFPTQAINEKLDVNGALPREILLSIALHRLMKVASGQTPLSSSRISLKDAIGLLKGAIPKLTLQPKTRYTFFEILNNAME